VTKSVTSPPEWRRRAALAPDAAHRTFPPAPAAPQDAGGGWLGPSGRPELGASALGGWAALEAGDDEAAGAAARFCARFAWEQPDDAPGVFVGWDAGGPAEPLARAHAPGQPYGDLGAAVVLLARWFEESGDDDALDAALELHDLVVALGDGVWQPANALVGWGGAVLYRVTGEDAFLATSERMADVLCEAQAPDGSWAEGDMVLTTLAAATLAAMADAVEAREEVED
jgi:hypothetical protein